MNLLWIVFACGEPESPLLRLGAPFQMRVKGTRD